MAPDSKPPRVFISYSHDTPEHEERVLALSNRLRAEGIDAVIDQYEPFPPKGWPHWMRQQIEEADFVLAVCTETYRRRAEGNEAAGRGLGGTYEGSIIDQELNEASGENRKFIPVVLSKKDSDHRPQFLRKYTFFTIDSDYEDLYRLLTNQPKAVKPELGRLRALPARVKRSDYRNVLWNIPPHNDFFTGRTEYLDALHKALAKGGTAALTQAIKGLGGIGKTQTAIEYANRYRGDYRAGFSITADSHDALISGLAALAGLLGLPVDQDLNKSAKAAKAWFESNSGWLLILDNVESLSDVKDWIPAGHRGHVLITTRLQATGTIAHGIDLPKMTSEEGVSFLLRRAKMENASEAERAAAQHCSEEVDGLPLALDQAGAYIEEAFIAPSEYLGLYRSEGRKLRAKPGDEHDSVSVTFSLAFEKLSEPARDIVRMCAFLAPDAIPEEVLSGGREPDVAFRDAIAETGKYSLIYRSAPNKTLEIHRLVQDVTKDGMDAAAQREWNERAVDALNQNFPEEIEFNTWPACERLLPHARIVASLVLHHVSESVGAARLLHQTAWYLLDRFQYTEAVRYVRRALEIRKKVLGHDHPATAQSLNNLAMLYQQQRQYQEAEPLFLLAMEINEKVLGPDHPNTARSLNNLAELFKSQGRHIEAEPLCKRALEICEKVLGSDHPNTAASLNNLAGLFESQGRHNEAEPLYKRALEINEKTLGPDHPDTAKSLNNLAWLFRSQGRHNEAEPLYKRALEINEKVLGPDHPHTATTLNNLAGLYDSQSRHNEAEPLMKRALEIREKALGPEHPDTAHAHYNLGNLYAGRGLFHKADPPLRRALSIAEKVMEAGDPEIARFANSYAHVLQKLGRGFEAHKLRVRFKR